MAHEENCGNCKFKKMGHVTIECRISPPTHILDKFKESKGVWPPVKPKDWCSEWEMKESKKRVVEDVAPKKAPEPFVPVTHVEPVEEEKPDGGVRVAVNPLTHPDVDDKSTSIAQKEIDDLNKAALDKQGYVWQEEPDPDDEVDPEIEEEVVEDESEEQPSDSQAKQDS